VEETFGLAYMAVLFLAIISQFYLAVLAHRRSLLHGIMVFFVSPIVVFFLRDLRQERQVRITMIVWGAAFIFLIFSPLLLANSW